VSSSAHQSACACGWLYVFRLLPAKAQNQAMSDRASDNKMYQNVRESVRMLAIARMLMYVRPNDLWLRGRRVHVIRRADERKKLFQTRRS
jgi:hypothetical protein